MRLINVSMVSYLNAKPFLYGIEKSGAKNKFNITLNFPAATAQKLKSGAADIALLPIAEISSVPNSLIITDYCIGCNGSVESVCIFSKVPIEEVKEIFLDYQSRTSVKLLSILLKEYWKVSPALLPSYPGYEENINGQTAGLIIGDRTFDLKNSFEFVYDLGAAWKEFTSFPFVFAAWVSRIPLSEEIIKTLNNAFCFGIENIDKVIAENQNQFPSTDVATYLKKNIQFNFDNEKKLGMKKFLEWK